MLLVVAPLLSDETEIGLAALDSVAALRSVNDVTVLVSNAVNGDTKRISSASDVLMISVLLSANGVNDSSQFVVHAVENPSLV